MKKSMSFAKQIHILKVVSGVAWIIAGIFNCFDNLVADILQIAALIVCITNLIRVFAANKENSDEMAQENLNKAKAKALDIMHFVLAFVAIAAMLFVGEGTITADWSSVILAVFFVVLGIEELIVGITFRKLEVE